MNSQRFYRLILACLSLVTSTTNAAAGGWVSSGGELLKDSHNPWWVKNTKDVKYCIQIDQQSISAKPDQIERIVDSGIRFWVTEISRRSTIFNLSEQLNPIFNSIGVGTQSFRKVACDGSEDLRLQFGFGTLNQAQRDYLRTPQRFVGVAVRTEYDEATLRGNGFIYITSDIGPHRYDGTPDMMDAPWKHESLLYFAVAHELGHVFGMPHTGERFSLMSAEFPEILMSKAIGSMVSEMSESDFDYFFVPKLESSRCLNSFNSASARAFFELPEGFDCLRFVIDDANKQLLVSANKRGASREIPIGVIDRLKLDSNTSPIDGITLILNPKQSIFPLMPPGNSWSILPGPHFLAGDGTGRLRLANGAEKPLFLKLAPNRFEIVGLNLGELHRVLTWNY